MINRFIIAAVLLPAINLAYALDAIAACGQTDFSAYMGALQKKIRSNWHPPRCHRSIRITTSFRVHSDGRISGISVKSPGLTDRQKEAAVAAIECSAPAAPLPTGSPESVYIEFTFDYNVHYYRPSGTYHPYRYWGSELSDRGCTISGEVHFQTTISPHR